MSLLSDITVRGWSSSIVDKRLDSVYLKIWKRHPLYTSLTPSKVATSASTTLINVTVNIIMSCPCWRLLVNLICSFVSATSHSHILNRHVKPIWNFLFWFNQLSSLRLFRGFLLFFQTEFGDTLKYSTTLSFSPNLASSGSHLPTCNDAVNISFNAVLIMQLNRHR